MSERIIGWAGIVLLGLAMPGCGGGADEAPAEPLTPLQQLESAVQSNPDDLEALHALAVAYHSEGRRDEAVGYFERLVEAKPETRNLIELGVAYASVSRTDDAETAFKRALESSVGNPVALHHLANLARSRGDTTEAISLYRQAVESNPRYLMAHFHLAEALRQNRQLEQAYRAYEQVINLEPQVEIEMHAFDASLLQMAGLDLQMGATERAVGLLKILVEAVPDHATAHLLLGQALMDLDRQEEARQELQIHQQLAARRAGSPAPGTDQPN